MPRPGGRGAGFTLLETIVALVLIVAAMVGPFSLATRSIFGAKFAKHKLTALNLAQEGIEIIRRMRETNVLKEFDWRGAGSCPAACTPLSDGTYQPDVFTSSALPLSTASPLSIHGTTGLYYQDPFVEHPTLFVREVIISTPSVERMRIVSTVTWTSAGIERRVRLEETLYNWE